VSRIKTGHAVAGGRLRKEFRSYLQLFSAYTM